MNIQWREADRRRYIGRRLMRTRRRSAATAVERERRHGFDRRGPARREAAAPRELRVRAAVRYRASIMRGAVTWGVEIVCDDEPHVQRPGGVTWGKKMPVKPPATQAHRSQVP